MRLTVKRRHFREQYTVGDLYVEGKKFCDTLEDTDRGLSSDMTLEEIAKRKIYGQTAIPTGCYRLIVNRSPRFRRELPRLLDVPGFDGILIHAGNTHHDTSGCILVGENSAKGRVLNSRYWESRLTQKLKGRDEVTITIE